MKLICECGATGETVNVYGRDDDGEVIVAKEMGARTNEALVWTSPDGTTRRVEMLGYSRWRDIRGCLFCVKAAP